MQSTRSRNDSMVGNLIVNADRLDVILSGISNSIDQHDRALTRLHELENHQIEMKKELNALKLELVTKETFDAVGITYDTSAIDERKSNSLVESEESKFDHSMTRRSSSFRRQKINEEVRRMSVALDTATLRDLRRDMVGLKAIIFQLQNDFNIEVANSATITSQIDCLQSNILKMETALGSCVHSTDMLNLKRRCNDDNDSLNRSIQAVEERMRIELDCQLQNKESEIKHTFNTLESLFMKRQANWDSKITTFAKKTDLDALMNNVDNENNDNKNRLDIVEKSIIENEQTLLDIKIRSAMVIIQNFSFHWKYKILRIAWCRWSDYRQYILEREEKNTKRKKKIRHILIKLWFSRKQAAWKKWYLYLHWHRRIESLKQQAVKLISNRMQQAINAPMYHAFNHIRRLTISDKIQRRYRTHYDLDNDTADLETSESFLNKVQSDNHNLSETLKSFRNDKDGAILTLAQEVTNMRCHEIKKIQKEIIKGDNGLQEHFENTVTEAVKELELQLDALETKLDENFESLSTQIPVMKSNISEMRSSLHGTINRVKIIEQTHRDRIELLCESNEASDMKITGLESELNQARIKINGLEYNNARSQNMINTLLQKVNDFEESNRKENSTMKERMSDLQDRLIIISAELHKGGEDRKLLNDSLVNVKNDLIQARIATEASVDSIHNILDSHGTRRPKMDLIIEDGLLYENISKEKNYVVQLNAILDGTTEINIVSHIASFVYDYAAWIAYEADHKVLQLVVTGKNPGGEAIYIEEDLVTIRKELLSR